MRDPTPGPQKGGPGPEGGGNTPKTNRRPRGGPGPRSQFRQPRPRPRGKVSIPTAWHPAASTVAKWVPTGFLPPKSSHAGNGETDALPRMVISGVGMFASHSKRAMVAPGCALCLCNVNAEGAAPICLQASPAPPPGWGAEAGFSEPTASSPLEELTKGGRDRNLQRATPEKPPPNPAKMLILNTCSRAAPAPSCRAMPPPRKERAEPCSPVPATPAGAAPGQSEELGKENTLGAGAAAAAAAGGGGTEEHSEGCAGSALVSVSGDGSAGHGTGSAASGGGGGGLSAAAPSSSNTDAAADGAARRFLGAGWGAAVGGTRRGSTRGAGRGPSGPGGGGRCRVLGAGRGGTRGAGCGAPCTGAALSSGWGGAHGAGRSSAVLSSSPGEKEGGGRDESSCACSDNAEKRTFWCSSGIWPSCLGSGGLRSSSSSPSKGSPPAEVGGNGARP
ncbi:uncharacterized protein GJ701_002490 [Geothlypis trichas]